MNASTALRLAVLSSTLYRRVAGRSAKLRRLKRDAARNLLAGPERGEIAFAAPDGRLLTGNPWQETAFRELVSGRGNLPFTTSERYWETRYGEGGTSGPGSYGRLAHYKAEFLNRFVERNGIRSVGELGCGDGAQLALARYPSYRGYDVSRNALALCRERFALDPTKSFHHTSDLDLGAPVDLALSLDVVYHLVEDDVFETYMRQLFSLSNRYVVIYSSDGEPAHWKASAHVKHRCFSAWVGRSLNDWALVQHEVNPWPCSGDPRIGSFADFFVFQHKGVRVEPVRSAGASIGRTRRDASP